LIRIWAKPGRDIQIIRRRIALVKLRYVDGAAIQSVTRFLLPLEKRKIASIRRLAGDFRALYEAF
jgi:hypothetical protein